MKARSPAPPASARPLPDAPVRSRDGRDGHLLENIGAEFTLLYVKNGAPPAVPPGIRLAVIGDDLIDTQGAIARRFDASPGAAYLLRPDQHLCARWRSFDRGKVAAARATAPWDIKEHVMGKLVTQSQFADPDAAYVALVEARRGLSEQAAAEIDTRLVLILANHIGDLDVLKQAIALAKAAK